GLAPAVFRNWKTVGTGPAARLVTGLFFLHHPCVRRVAAPAGPAGELRVAGIDADEFAVLRADVDAPALDRRLEAQLGADLVSLGDLPLLRLDLEYVAFQRREEDLSAGGGGWGGEEPAFLLQVALELEAPEFLARFRVGADEFVAHAVVILAPGA